MEQEKYDKAVAIKNKIYGLKNNLKDLSDGHWDKVEITLKTGYSDMGRDIERSTTFDEEISYKIGKFVKTLIDKQISELEQEFEAL